MLTDLPLPVLLLLHEGGWDEVAMVAVGLLAAYLVIMWTGRRSREDEEDDDDEIEEDDVADVGSDRTVAQKPPVPDEPPRPLP
jgi:hypothetical protein